MLCVLLIPIESVFTHYEQGSAGSSSCPFNLSWERALYLGFDLTGRLARLARLPVVPKESESRTNRDCSEVTTACLTRAGHISFQTEKTSQTETSLKSVSVFQFD